MGVPVAERKRDVLARALKRFQKSADATAKIRRESEEDLKFYAGEQWPNELKQVRELSQRPCLTINRSPQFVRQITNDQRQNRPEIKVIPTDDSTEDTAKILEGLIRHIQKSSDSEVAYDTACENQVVMGFGYIRVNTKYCDDETFDQEIAIEEIKNPFNVYFDPAAVKPDYRDARFCFVAENMTKDEFEVAYPRAKYPGANSSGGALSSIGDLPPGWATDDTCRVVEYFEVQEKQKKIYQLSDGSIVDELPDYLMQEVKETPEDEALESEAQQMGELALGVEGLTVVNERYTMERVVMWYKMTAVEILEQRKWPGKYIPIVPVLGDVLNINGETQIVGMLRYMRDPQRMYNYWVSAQTEMIALAPKAPFIIAEGQIEGYEEFWKNANVKPYSHLPYRPTTINGVLVPPPQRNQAEPPIQAMAHMTQQAGEDLKNVTGIYDASLGAKSNETSGRAIIARQKEGDTANFHFIDNLSRAIKHVGVIIYDLADKIYDTARVIRILHEDGQEELVKINQMFGKGQNKKQYNFAVGRYDIMVVTGPSYSTKREAAAESMIALVQANPGLWQIAGDLIVKNMDWPGAEEFAERLRETLPPQFVKNSDDQDPIPPQIQTQLMQSQQMIEQLTTALNEANDKLETKVMDLESKERIATQNNETALAIAEIKNNMSIFLEELNHLRSREKLLQADKPVSEAANANSSDQAQVTQ